MNKKKVCKICGKDVKKAMRVIPYNVIPNIGVDVDPWNIQLVFHGDPSVSVFPGFIGTEVETCGYSLQGQDEEVEVDCYCDSPCCRGYYTEWQEGDGVASNEDIASMFAHAFKDYNEELFMFVSDSSIYGVEAVTHPMTYEFMRQNLYAGWYHLERYMKAFEINEPSESHRAGMHIHLSVDAFNDDKHLKRYAQLCEMFYDQIVYNIGQRNSVRYTPSSGIYAGLEEDEFLESWYANRKNYEKFQIVNTSKTYTVELRAFKAPQTRERYFAYVQLAIVLFTIAKRNKKILHLRWSDVRAYAENMNFAELIQIWS
jgi:hypothetical protein